MTRRPHLFSLLGAVLAALVVCVGASAADGQRTGRHGVSHRLSAKQKVAVRRQLRSRLRRNPRAALSGDFLQRAQDSGLTLPLTLRLNRFGQATPDDELRVQWDDSTWPWPSDFLTLQPSPGGGLITLDGRSSIEAQFGNDLSGYGSGVGAVETVNGALLSFSGDVVSPIDVATSAACPASGVALQMRRMDLSTGEATHGLLSLFGGTARVSLHVRASTTSHAMAADCATSLDSSPDSRHSATVADPLVPIVFDAVFHISPAVTADGKIRFGTLTVADGSVQPTSFARITLCVEPAVDPDTCRTEQFPARVSIKQMTAEVLLGDQMSS